MEKLSEYGPDTVIQTWLPDFMMFGSPELIYDENAVAKYPEEVYFYRAVCGGFFLFSLVTGLAPISISAL